MRCRSCRHDNPVGARFCVACGTRLATACAACGVELPEGARFCPACGGAIEPTRPTVAPAHAPDAYTPRHLAERILTSRAALSNLAQPSAPKTNSLAFAPPAPPPKSLVS
jgi:adenylate cyclase